MHNPFDQLARDVQTEWQKANDNLEAFTAIATKALENFNYGWSRPQFDQFLADWMLTTARLPEQVNVHNTFGQPPVTLFNNDRFVVDVYIWMGCDTSIHSHGFRGAFKVLHGRSLHESFEIDITEKIADDVVLTKHAPPASELLHAGDTRTIRPGGELTHRVIHLEEPTITLCVKTINERDLRQWHHFIRGGTADGLAIQKRHLDAGLIKQIYYFQYLHSQDDTAAGKFLNRLLDGHDISTIMNLCEEISREGYDLRADLVQQILETVYHRYGEANWFRLYAESSEASETEIRFNESPSPRARLAAHFVNEGRTWSQSRDTLAALSGQTVSKKEIEFELLSLIDEENPEASSQKSALHSFLET